MKLKDIFGVFRRRGKKNGPKPAGEEPRAWPTPEDAEAEAGAEWPAAAEESETDGFEPVAWPSLDDAAQGGWPSADDAAQSGWPSADDAAQGGWPSADDAAQSGWPSAEDAGAADPNAWPSPEDPGTAGELESWGTEDEGGPEIVPAGDDRPWGPEDQEGWPDEPDGEDAADGKKKKKKKRKTKKGKEKKPKKRRKKKGAEGEEAEGEGEGEGGEGGKKKLPLLLILIPAVVLVAAAALLLILRPWAKKDPPPPDNLEQVEPGGEEPGGEEPGGEEPGSEEPGGSETPPEDGGEQVATPTSLAPAAPSLPSSSEPLNTSQALSRFASFSPASLGLEGESLDAYHYYATGRTTKVDGILCREIMVYSVNESTGTNEFAGRFLLSPDSSKVYRDEGGGTVTELSPSSIGLDG